MQTDFKGLAKQKNSHGCYFYFFREQVSAASNIYLCFVSDYFYMAEDVWH